MEVPAQLRYSLQKMLYPILDQLDPKTLRQIGDMVLKILKENIARLEQMLTQQSPADISYDLLSLKQTCSISFLLVGINNNLIDLQEYMQQLN